MHTENTVYMQASPERIFELAAHIENWPQILPHYRTVTVLESSEYGLRKHVTMAANRTGFPVPGTEFPVQWRSIQICEPETGRIYFKHLAGVAQGMWVVWSIVPDAWGRGTQVTIAHDLRYPIEALNGWFARELVGQGFVHAIAGRTLETIKSIVERESTL